MPGLTGATSINRGEDVKTQILMASGALALALGGAAYADTSYSSFAAFAAATTGDTTYGFAGIAPPGGWVGENSPFTHGPITYSGQQLFVLDGGLFGYYGAQPYLTSQYGQPNTTTLALAGATAIGIDFGSYYNFGDALSFTLSDGSVFNTTLPGTYAQETFIGFTSSTPITSVTIVDNSAGLVTDIIDVTLGAAVPEPAAWMTMLIGIFGLGVVLRSRRRAAAASA
jgi:hypothetical protein